MLLYEGREIFFGPANAAADYFTALGFVRPIIATTPDFLTSITNPAERVVREGWSNRTPRSRDDFVAAWRTSSQAKLLLGDIAEFESTNSTNNKVSKYSIDKQLQGGVKR